MDIADTFEASAKVPGNKLLQFCLFGPNTAKWPELKAEMSPLEVAKPGQDYPPFLLLHGDADQVVPYHQMVDMYEKLSQDGYDVTAYRVKGANHERDFWSQPIYDVIRDYIDQKVK